MRSPEWALATVDIDGTLTTVHGWRVISEAFGRREEFERTSRRYFAKEIGEDEHLENMMAVATGRTVRELEAVLESTPRLGNIAEGVRDLHDRGTRVALLTHNPPYVCAWYCRKFGFDDFEGTPAQSVVDGVIQAPQAVRADKPGGLRALLERSGGTAARTVHVGDGWADAALFPLVGGGIALDSSRPEVGEAADLALRTGDFREVAAAVRSLRPRR